MRGNDDQQLDVFSYVSPEQRVPQDHPLRTLRAMTDEALQQLKYRFNKLYATTGRPSTAPERLSRALLLQVLYSLRSERLLMEQLDLQLAVSLVRGPGFSAFLCGTSLRSLRLELLTQVPRFPVVS